MVLGLRSKNKRTTSTQVHYTIHIQEIKPWPPSQSMKSLRSVILQWENGGDRNSGFTAPVIPGQSKIEFNESFKLQVTLLKENSSKSFLKNVLDLNLYETRRDKIVKGQLLGSAVVDLAGHGIVKDTVSFCVPLNCKRSYRNTVQPVVYCKIEPIDKVSESSSSRGSLSKETSLDNDGRDSVSALMSEEYAEEAEIASFTDDDVSSHSSPANSASTVEAGAYPAIQCSRGEQNESKAVNERRGAGNVGANVSLGPAPEQKDLGTVTAVLLNGSAIHQNVSVSQPPPIGLSTDTKIPDNKSASLSHSFVPTTSDAPITPSLSSVAYEVTDEEIRSGSIIEGFGRNDLHQLVKEKMVDCTGDVNIVESPSTTAEFYHQREMLNPASTAEVDHQREMQNPASTSESEQTNGDKKSLDRDGSDKPISSNGNHNIFVERNVERPEIISSEEKCQEVQNHSTEIEASIDSSPKGSIASHDSLGHSIMRQHKYLQNSLKEPLDSDMTMTSERVLGEKGSGTLTSNRPKNMIFSMRSPPHSLGSMRNSSSDMYMEDVKEIDVQEDLCNSGTKSVTRDGIDEQDSIKSGSNKVKLVSRGNNYSFSNNEVKELELRVEMLEAELREAAAVEIGLYSIVAEHGSSMHKVHTPARRLSRLYIHASKQYSQERKASAARSVVSGLVLAAKACGNDIPRLTFWLSNSIMLRAIVTQAFGRPDVPNSAGPYPAANGSQPMAKGKSSPLKWESTYKKEKFSLAEEFVGWEDLYTFTAAIERIESWIFSRIIESIWWQILTPHMQSINKTCSHTKKSFQRQTSLGDQQQTSLSIETWKKAFDDACERLCPLRAEGHECGCLPMLARLVMEQCVARLDVAIFNAILRESDDEIPTDPVSDPISDPKVLPIPPGKSSFGVGAQLKNAVGNWSRWLTDLFGMDVDDSLQDKGEEDDYRLDVATSPKSFHLLNALSDLLMLPKDMLLEKSIRKEVCPAFSSSIIKRIISSFLPDEFCPDPIPENVLEALNSEDPLESSEEEGIRHFPCNASPVMYSPPSVASIVNIIGDVRTTSLLRRSGSSVVRKCHTSDDELDELDSPLTSIVKENAFTLNAKSKGNCCTNTLRYQLLRDVWRYDK